MHGHRKKDEISKTKKLKYSTRRIGIEVVIMKKLCKKQG